MPEGPLLFVRPGSPIAHLLRAAQELAPCGRRTVRPRQGGRDSAHKSDRRGGEGGHHDQTLRRGWRDSAQRNTAHLDLYVHDDGKPTNRPGLPGERL